MLPTFRKLTSPLCFAAVTLLSLAVLPPNADAQLFPCRGSFNSPSTGMYGPPTRGYGAQPVRMRRYRGESMGGNGCKMDRGRMPTPSGNPPAPKTFVGDDDGRMELHRPPTNSPRNPSGRGGIDDGRNPPKSKSRNNGDNPPPVPPIARHRDPVWRVDPPPPRPEADGPFPIARAVIDELSNRVTWRPTTARRRIPIWETHGVTQRRAIHSLNAGWMSVRGNLSLAGSPRK